MNAGTNDMDDFFDFFDWITEVSARLNLSANMVYNKKNRNDGNTTWKSFHLHQ